MRCTCCCLCRDYRAIDDLDHYETEGLDESFVDDADIEERADARQQADAYLNRRDGRRRRRAGRVPIAFAEDSDSEERPSRRRRVQDELAEEEDEVGDGAMQPQIDQHAIFMNTQLNECSSMRAAVL